ncbi:MAG: pyridoxal phosphate-dependent aminotransferase [Halobacteriovoraceae bacterium]|nr:pyridoxal phosphate-dependent aminotransferase [Halobacteriovoraceae bacterium]MCB9095671.1 pyridoxal phosphate-dependent aminotransferase [Halobacteriovoraceae bacterium]
MLSQRVRELPESATLAMARKATELKQKGVDIISMSLGEPDFGAPEFLKEAAIQAIHEGHSHYPPVPGYLDLRETICEKLKRDNNLEYSANEVVVSTGAKQSIANLILATINPGDEVILPAPFWVSYYDVIKFAGGVPVILNTDISTHFKITVEQLRDAFSSKTKLFLFSNPCNPSGSVYSEGELRELAKEFVKYPEVMIVSDEIYEYITFNEQNFSIGSIPELKKNVITINGLSKAYAVTGWRLGYLAAPEEIAKACSKIQSQFTSGANAITQRVAVAALKAGKEKVSYMRETFLKRRDHLISEIAKNIPVMKTNVPDGAFYLFPDVSAFLKGKISNTNDLCQYLLEKAHVAATPGEAFGCPRNIRLSYALNEQQISEAVNRMAQALKEL